MFLTIKTIRCLFSIYLKYMKNLVSNVFGHSVREGRVQTFLWQYGWHTFDKREHNNVSLVNPKTGSPKRKTTTSTTTKKEESTKFSAPRFLGDDAGGAGTYSF